MGTLSDTVGSFAPGEEFTIPDALDPGPHRLRRTDRRAGGGRNPGVGRRVVATASFRPLRLHRTGIWHPVHSPTQPAARPVGDRLRRRRHQRRTGRVHRVIDLLRGPRVGRRTFGAHRTRGTRTARLPRVPEFGRSHAGVLPQLRGPRRRWGSTDQRRRIARVTVLGKTSRCHWHRPGCRTGGAGDALPPAATTRSPTGHPSAPCRGRSTSAPTSPSTRTAGSCCARSAPSPTVATRPSR